MEEKGPARDPDVAHGSEERIADTLLREIRERRGAVGPPNGLQRLLALEDESAPALACGGERPREWFKHGDWRVYAPPVEGGVGTVVASFSGADEREAALFRDAVSGRVFPPFDLATAYDLYVSEGWVAETAQRKLSPWQLDAFYRLKRFVPRKVQLAARRSLARRQQQPEFPAWPLDRSVVRLLRLFAYCTLLAQGRREAGFRWFWPDGHRAALILTHDVEEEEGFRLALEVADLEEELGFRSSFNVGGWYPIDWGVVHELSTRGFEIGSHGLSHDRSLFGSRKAFETQLPALRDVIDRLGASGFRSPSTYRVFDWIGELPVDYDCSMPHSDPFEPQPGGCCTLWPFFVGKVVELPYTLPQDHTLFTLLGQRTAELWLEQATAIEEEFGLIHCLSHPDRGYLAEPRNRALYREFLTAMAERHEVWKALPQEVAAWWRQRDVGEVQAGLGTVRIDEGADVVLEPPARSLTAGRESRL